MPMEKLAERHSVAISLQGFITEQENRLWKSIFVKRLAACPVWMGDAAMLIRRRQRARGIPERKGLLQKSGTGNTRGISGSWHQSVRGCREKILCTAERFLLTGEQEQWERRLFTGDTGEAAIITGSGTGAGCRTEK